MPAAMPSRAGVRMSVQVILLFHFWNCGCATLTNWPLIVRRIFLLASMLSSVCERPRAEYSGTPMTEITSMVLESGGAPGYAVIGSTQAQHRVDPVVHAWPSDLGIGVCYNRDGQALERSAAT